MLKHLSCLCLLLAACGNRATPFPDGARDAPPPRDSVGLEGSVVDGPAPLDQAPRDHAVNPNLYAALFVDKLWADCMPAVPPDPVSLTGHAEFLNSGGATLGPIQLGQARLVDLAGNQLGTFEVKPIAPLTLKPGEGGSPAVEKVAGSFKPAGACQYCGKPARVELGYSGAGIPAGARMVSSQVALSCAY